MMSSLLLMTLVSMGPLPTTPSQASGKLVPGQLRCEAMVNPVGIGTASPRLSWRPTATGAKAFNLSQTKYRILVASRVDRLNPDKADLWDTGLVTSAETTDILYRGKPLGSNRAAFWRVQIVDQGGKASPWSAPAQFSTGLLKPSDWKAQWIGYDAPLAKFEKGDAWSAASWIWSQTPAEIGPMYFQRQFEVERGLVKAVAHMTADDQFTLSLNLIKAAESDGKTDAWRRPVTADVTKLLSEGTNVIAVRASNTEGEAAALIGSLTLQYDDGRTVQIVTNGTWSSSRTDRAERSAARVLGAYGMSPWGKFSAAGLKLPAPRLLRREFGVVKKVQRATLYGSALGLIELHLNGSPVSDELFVPGWTDYVKRVYARAYDVTSRIRPGQNALGAILGDGWYAGYVGFGGIREHYGAKIRAKVQLEIEYTDGTKATVASGPDWQASTGPTLEADFLMGEAYDARQEIPGWSKPGFTAKWKPVDTGAEMNPAVEAFPGQ
ncbi:MAG: alpha-L-rhamnosidase N-terminal domain-containing protein, partial [Fimbriimonas sp.]